jgi:hypothetical protein
MNLSGIRPPKRLSQGKDHMIVILSRRRRISSITLTLPSPIGMGEGEDEILRLIASG